MSVAEWNWNTTLDLLVSPVESSRLDRDFLSMNRLGRKRLQVTTKQNSSSAQSPPRSRSDEDSGLGDTSSFDGEHTAECGVAKNTTSPPALVTAKPGKPLTGVVFPTFRERENKIFVDTGINFTPKRPRLDITEEANELPEQENSSFLPRQETTPKIVSFKNVPGLSRPTNPVQLQSGTSFLSLPPRSVQPKSCLVEQLLKPKLVSSLKPVSKAEKSSKKKGKCHILEGNLPSKSSDGACELVLLSQPEGQHRARYQTEGSRGAVKDRRGNGHPSVKLHGYCKSAVLQVFVASDGGSVSPHLFYQVCKVSGKNSTPCKEERIHGTTVLEILLLPEKDMTVSCDCVGILKERNVDVEQRVKSFVSRGKKRSTKCRLVFRTVVTLASGAQEVLQVVSQPISCTQPPGVPEICRKSRSECSVEGNKELFIIGKNFYKDTEVLFMEVENQTENVIWSHVVTPEKEYLQSNHLICQIPPYHDKTIVEEVEVRVIVVSCNKLSDPHSFSYLPIALKTETPHDSTQLMPLPKGVSPNAVKLNQLYAESGSGGSLSTKECFYVPNPIPTLPSTAGVKERAVVHPVPTNRVLATVNPQVHTTASLVTKLPQKTNSNTLTTATILTPKPTPNSIPSTTTEITEVKHLTQGNVVVGEKQQIKHKENLLENLIQVLKLLKTFPGSLQAPIFDLVTDEIQKQFKESPSIVKREREVEENSNPLPSIAVLSNLNNKPANTQSNLQKERTEFVFRSNAPMTCQGTLYASRTQSDLMETTQTNVIQSSPQSNTIESSRTVACNFQPDHGLTQIDERMIVPLTTSVSSFPIVSIQNTQGQNLQCDVKGVYPVPIVVSRDEVYDTSKQKCEYAASGINEVNELGTACQTNSSMMLNILPEDHSKGRDCQEYGVKSLNQYFIDSKEEKSFFSEGEITKINVTPTINSLPQNCIANTSSSLVPRQNDLNIGLSQGMFEGGYDLTHTAVTIAPTSQSAGLLPSKLRILNKGKGENLLPNANGMSLPNSQLNKNVSLTETSFSLEETTQGGSIDASLALQVEGCDPLLSQANSVSSMSLHTTSEEPTMTLHPGDGTAMIHCPSSTMSSSVASEVSIAQLSENDLLNYINPSCFDSV